MKNEEIIAKDYTKLTDKEILEEIESLKSFKITILKYKLDLLKIYLLNKKIYELDTPGGKSEKILKTMKYTATLIEKINKIINKAEYKEKNEKFDEQTTKDVIKNEGIVFMKSRKGNPKKTNREKLEKLNNKKSKKLKIKINDKINNPNKFE